MHVYMNVPFMPLAWLWIFLTRVTFPLIYAINEIRTCHSRGQRVEPCVAFFVQLPWLQQVRAMRVQCCSDDRRSSSSVGQKMEESTALDGFEHHAERHLMYKSIYIICVSL